MDDDLKKELAMIQKDIDSANFRCVVLECLLVVLLIGFISFAIYFFPAFQKMREAAVALDEIDRNISTYTNSAPLDRYSGYGDTFEEAESNAVHIPNN